MRVTIMIRRQRSNPDDASLSSTQPVLVGEEATRALSCMSGVSEVRSERLYGDRALLSYESSAARMTCELVDAVLRCNGMNRLA